MKEPNILASLDKALARPSQEKPIGFSAQLAAENRRALKFKAAAGDIAALEEQDEAKQRGLAYTEKHSRHRSKTEWLRRQAAAAQKIAAGEHVEPITRAALEAEFGAGRDLGRKAAQPAAAAQVAIVQKIMFELAAKIETNVVELSNLSHSAIAALLVDDVQTVAKIQLRQAYWLRTFATKIKPSPGFNWKTCLKDFGLID